jgi:hypothetical protein
VERGAEVRAGEEIAMRAVEGVFEQVLRPLRFGYASVELVDLALGEPTPVFAPPAVCRQQLTDLSEREAGVW